ncbi:DUF2809 domain-containing protein [Longispora sp. K20-0274]|uniref:ribosomal maturation YjgA family protein n=1 Tax=Longispora sp. K20-0274 TaxID=3088255 RepID=UPI0039997B8C
MVIKGGTVRLLMPVAAALFLAVALGVRYVTSGNLSSAGSLAQLSGTALYASMIYAGVLFCRPRTRPLPAGALAVAFCWAVEFFQITGVPAYLSERSLLARVVLGVTFDWVDIAWYPVGVVPLVALHRLLRPRVV